MVLRDKHVVRRRTSRISIAELARHLAVLTGGGLIAHGTAISPSPAYDPTRVEEPSAAGLEYAELSTPMPSTCRSIRRPAR